MTEPEPGLEWLRYARDDLVAARILAASPNVSARHACLLAQQAAEKGLKAALLAAGFDPPRHHNLNALRNLLPAGWAVTVEQPDLTELGVWAVEARYPSELPDPTTADAIATIEQARAVLQAIERDLRRRGFNIQGKA